eukprot:gene14775-biopygen3648
MASQEVMPWREDSHTCLWGRFRRRRHGPAMGERHLRVPRPHLAPAAARWERRSPARRLAGQPARRPYHWPPGPQRPSLNDAWSAPGGRRWSEAA